MKRALKEEAVGGGGVGLSVRLEKRRGGGCGGGGGGEYKGGGGITLRMKRRWGVGAEVGMWGARWR